MASETWECSESQIQAMARRVIDLLERKSRVSAAPFRALGLRVAVSRRPERVNAFTVHTDSGPEIVVGGGLCGFLSHYTRAAATYFLASPEGTRPSELWPDARSSLASAIEWLSSPSRSPRMPAFEMTERQAAVSEAFGAYAMRFALCHEIAHVALEHEPVHDFELEAGAAQRSIVEFSQNQEREADRYGLQLQIASLPQRDQLVNAIASAAYMIHAVELLNLRLMLLARLIDSTRWRARVTHPPLLERTFRQMGAAESVVPGGGAGLESLHDQLAALNGEVIGEASSQQDSVTDSARKLIDDESTRAAGALGSDSRSVAAATQTLSLDAGDPQPALAPQILELFGRSPLGVLAVLDVSAAAPERDLAPRDLAPRDLALLALVERLKLELPEEFASFLACSPQQRTDAILGLAPT